jgi:hypothetical protein
MRSLEAWWISRWISSSKFKLRKKRKWLMPLIRPSKLCKKWSTVKMLYWRVKKSRSTRWGCKWIDRGKRMLKLSESFRRNSQSLRKLLSTSYSRLLVVMTWITHKTNHTTQSPKEPWPSPKNNSNKTSTVKITESSNLKLSFKVLKKKRNKFTIAV